MKPFAALVQKQIHETRWMLGLSAAALFALGWLYVFVTSLNETEILKALASDSADNRFRWMRSLGMLEQPPSVAIMMAFWNSPFILLTVAAWAIARGSIAVGAEVERGTLDLVLSRPITRTSYLASHVCVALAGLLFLSLSLAAGAAAGTHYNTLRQPPGFSLLVQPAVNLAALGLPIYGYTLFVSSLDHVRWRATLIGSVLTLGGFIAWVVSRIPVLQNMKWKPWLERISIFQAYDPVEAVTAGESLPLHVSILVGIGGVFIVLSFLALARRDLPANG